MNLAIRLFMTIPRRGHLGEAQDGPIDVNIRRVEQPKNQLVVTVGSIFTLL